MRSYCGGICKNHLKAFQNKAQMPLETFFCTCRLPLLTMRFRCITLLLLLSLFAASAHSAWACGSESNDHRPKAKQESSEKACCSEGKAPVAEDSQPQHDGSDCPCDHEHGGCHCPGCGMVGSSGAAFTLAVSPVPATASLPIVVQKMAFYFAEHLPEAVYLPIWQPPKLDA